MGHRPARGRLRRRTRPAAVEQRGRLPSAAAVRPVHDRPGRPRAHAEPPHGVPAPHGAQHGAALPPGRVSRPPCRRSGRQLPPSAGSATAWLVGSGSSNEPSRSAATSMPATASASTTITRPSRRRDIRRIARAVASIRRPTAKSLRTHSPRCNNPAKQAELYTVQDRPAFKTNTDAHDQQPLVSTFRYKPPTCQLNSVRRAPAHAAPGTSQGVPRITPGSRCRAVRIARSLQE